MKTYLEVRDIIGLLSFMGVSKISIVDEENEQLLECSEWNTKTLTAMKRKQYMNYYPTLIGIGDNKEMVVHCIAHE